MEPGQVFVLLIIAMTMFAGIVRTAIKARHGYPIEEGRRARRAMRRPFGPIGRGMAARYDDGEDELQSQRKIELLSSENERLTGQIGRLEERLRVLERIATDPAERTAREIEALRDTH
ncbi:hypothetical protein [Sphingomonas aracearum]|uniref:Uncharacterized protein n=1 Tax=Sphingomonas aracearum TaxID=2283317 RepID=A0A369VS53_9SPHN|nr:hypothetical protein [Sphingomonas aracearum]RDE05216.1 hypothetical protein DVW87_08050 [Sphingomonas aracearum]